MVKAKRKPFVPRFIAAAELKEAVLMAQHVPHFSCGFPLCEAWAHESRHYHHDGAQLADTLKQCP